jgi:hypothetical protein
MMEADTLWDVNCISIASDHGCNWGAFVLPHVRQANAQLYPMV